MRTSSHEGNRIFVASDEYDLVSLYRYGFFNREVVVNGRDLSVTENKVGLLRFVCRKVPAALSTRTLR